MINKKFIFANLIFAILILFGAQAQARGFWAATVYYSNNTSFNISAPSYDDCEVRRTEAIDNPPSNTTFIGSTDCHQILDLSELEKVKDLRDVFNLERVIPFPFPWPPCLSSLSCPHDLKGKILELIYPDHHKDVQQLIKNYGVETYTSELLNLQQKFDLEGFEKELSEIERNIEFR
ncbi:MAG: hypothetical protein L3J59_13290 [Methylococcaceae bacterium]|nr:hypothetical protein [Methylococcaceae bacterium]